MNEVEQRALRLRIWVQERGMTQKDVAEKVGKSLGYVNDLLKGRCRFGRQTAKVWHDAFGLSEGWLISGEGAMMDDGVVPGLLGTTGASEPWGGHLADISPTVAELMAMLRRTQEALAESQRLNGRLVELYDKLADRLAAIEERVKS